MTDLAIIIVSWNVKEMLTACLRSVQADLAAGALAGQIWVIDNASNDGSAAMLRRDFPTVHLIASQRNLGFAGGNNTALRAIGFSEAGAERSNGSALALPDAVLLLNPDTEVHPGALSQMVTFLQQRPEVGVVGPQLEYGDGSFQHSAFALPGLWQLAIELLPVPGRLVESSLNGRYARDLYAQDRPFEVGHPLGAAMCVRREAIEQVGFLDEAYHMYVEEVDWGKRIVAAGWKAYCLPQAKITHYGGQSTEQKKTDSFLNLWRSRYHFYRKHYGPLRIWLAGQIVRLGMRRKIKQERQALNRGELTPAEASERQLCYHRIIDLWRGSAQNFR